MCSSSNTTSPKNLKSIRQVHPFHKTSPTTRTAHKTQSKATIFIGKSINTIVNNFTVNTREDIWRIPADTSILTVNCSLSMHTANEIVEKCRELHRLIIDGQVYARLNNEIREYLNENLHVEIRGHVTPSLVSPETEKYR